MNKEKIKQIAKWVLSNPIAISFIFSTVLGAISIMIENSHYGPKLYFTFESEPKGEEVYR